MQYKELDVDPHPTHPSSSPQEMQFCCIALPDAIYRFLLYGLARSDDDNGNMHVFCFE